MNLVTVIGMRTRSELQGTFSGLAFTAQVIFWGVFVSNLAAQTPRNARPATASADEGWVIRWNRSDDFNGAEIDWKKWHPNPEHFSGWRWDNPRNTEVKDGSLKIVLRENPEHSKEVRDAGGKPVRFTSGMLKSYAKGTYGYYEAASKGRLPFPGHLPPFCSTARLTTVSWRRMKFAIVRSTLLS